MHREQRGESLRRSAAFLGAPPRRFALKSVTPFPCFSFAYRRDLNLAAPLAYLLYICDPSDREGWGPALRAGARVQGRDPWPARDLIPPTGAPPVRGLLPLSLGRAGYGVDTKLRRARWRGYDGRPGTSRSHCVGRLGFGDGCPVSEIARKDPLARGWGGAIRYAKRAAKVYTYRRRSGGRAFSRGVRQNRALRHKVVGAQTSSGGQVSRAQPIWATTDPRRQGAPIVPIWGLRACVLRGVVVATAAAPAPSSRAT